MRSTPTTPITIALHQSMFSTHARTPRMSFGATDRIFISHNLGAGRQWQLTSAATAAGRGGPLRREPNQRFHHRVVLRHVRPAAYEPGTVRVWALDGSGAAGVSEAFAVTAAPLGSVNRQVPAARATYGSAASCVMPVVWQSRSCPTSPACGLTAPLPRPVSGPEEADAPAALPNASPNPPRRPRNHHRAHPKDHERAHAERRRGVAAPSMPAPHRGHRLSDVSTSRKRLVTATERIRSMTVAGLPTWSAEVSPRWRLRRRCTPDGPTRPRSRQASGPPAE